MKRLIILGAVLVLLPAVNAWAERCIGPMDTSALVTTTYGVAPFSTSDIVFCDDYDSYCNYNYTNTIYWPGYPPSPDTTLCASATDGMEWWVKTCNCIDHHNWDKDWGGPNFGVNRADYGTGGLRLEGWNGNSGWASLPYVVSQAGNQSPVGRAYYDFDMAGGIVNKFPGNNAVNGTDLNPLTLRFWLNDNQNIGDGNIDQGTYWQFYMELRLDADRAPVDFVMSADTIPYCVAEHINWPIICQQNPSGAGSLPANCPDIGINPRPIHNSLAFGWLASLCLDPCTISTRKPTMYHAATFDGQKWFRLIGNQHPGNGGDFNYDQQQAFFEMTIKSSTYDVRLIAPACQGTGCSSLAVTTSTATNLPRLYTGPFNYISMGAGLGCELDPANPWQCKAGSPRNTSPWTWNSNPAYVDRPVLFGGVGNLSTGACCKNDGSCEELSPAACTAVPAPLGPGRFHGSNTFCASTVCCPLPFADADHDGDVDQDDFGAFQVCYTGTVVGVPTGCACFDRNGDNAINDTDFQAFNNCWTGANVQWTQAGSPLCQP